MSEIIGQIIILIGAVFCLAGCIGLVRLQDFYLRFLSVLKSVLFGICLMLFGMFIYSGFTGMGIRALLSAIFSWLTIPIIIQSLVSSAHEAYIRNKNQQKLKAKDVMTKEVVTIAPDATLADAIELLVARGISGLPVLNSDKKVIGIISEKDILNIFSSGNLHITKVEDVMTKRVISFSSDTDVDKIALCISENKFRRVPIIDNGKLVGIISRRNIIKRVLEHM